MEEGSLVKTSFIFYFRPNHEKLSAFMGRLTGYAVTFNQSPTSLVGKVNL
jgi:hypothetical protein